MQFLVTMLCVLSPAVLALDAPQQPTQPARGRAQPAKAGLTYYDPIFFKLSHANCYQICHLLSDLLPGCNCIPVEESNCVVFSGPEESRDLAHNLVKQMDIPAEPGKASDVTIATVKHRRVEELVDHIMRLVEGRKVVASADRARSKILLRGAPDEIARAKSLLEQLDTPAPTIAVEFSFIQANANALGEAKPLPIDLKDVGEELQRFGHLTLLGRLSTVAVEGERFGVEGMVVPGIKSQIRGQMNSGGQEGSIKMDIKAMLELKSAGAEGQAHAAKSDEPFKGPQPAPYFQIETSISIQRGEYLVLGSAPTGSAIGESAILVMHVQDAGKH